MPLELSDGDLLDKWLRRKPGVKRARTMNEALGQDPASSSSGSVQAPAEPDQLPAEPAQLPAEPVQAPAEPAPAAPRVYRRPARAPVEPAPEAPEELEQAVLGKLSGFIHKLRHNPRTTSRTTFGRPSDDLRTTFTKTS